MGKLQKILLSLLISSHLAAGLPKSSMAQEINKFKNYSEQKYGMGVPAFKAPQFSSLKELEEEAHALMEAEEKKLTKLLLKYSDYQKGQLAFYFLYAYYNLSPEQRQKSEDGKRFYALLAGLYKFKEKKDFKDGSGDKKIQAELALKDSEKFLAFTAVLTEKYPAYRESAAEKKQTILPLPNYLLEGYDQKELPQIVSKLPKKVDVLALIRADTLDKFISALGVPVGVGASREDKAKELTKTFQEAFSTSEENARQLVKATLYTYFLLKDEDKEAFTKWLKGLTEAERKQLASRVETASEMRKITLPSEEVKKMFLQSKMAKEEAKKKEEESLKQLEKAYTKYVRENDFKYFAENFEKYPSGNGIEILEKRLEYIQKKKALIKDKKDEKSKKEVAKINEELAFVEKWLEKFGLLAGTPEGKLAEIKNGMVMVQTAYFTLSSANLKLIDYFKGTMVKRELRDIYVRYALNIDKTTGRLFVDLDTTKKNFPEKAADIAVRALDPKIMKNAQQVLQSEYYTPSLGPEALIDKPLEAAAFGYLIRYIGEESPLMATTFLKYVDQAKRSGVTNAKEKELVTSTALRLAGLNPVLVIKYFAALKHLADICTDNPDAFIRALEIIKARVDAVTEPIYNPTSTFQMTQPNIRTMINRLSFAFDAMIYLDKNKLTQYNRYDLMDNNIFISPTAPHLITQKPPGYKYPLTAGKEAPGYYLTPYPFPYYLDKVPYGTPFAGGGVNNYGQYGYGGTLSLPTVGLLNISSGADEVGAAVKGYLFAGHPVIGVPEYFPKTRITGLSATELLSEINKAFISTEPLRYDKTVVGGGGFAGVVGKKPGEEWEIGAGALGTLLTPTGGAAFGGSYETSGKTFAGASVVAMPIGYIKKGAAKGKEVGVESILGGYEQLDDGTKKLLLTSITNVWDPENPSDVLITVNREETAEGKAWMTSRLFYVDKNGTIFDVKGGTNDFIEMLNFFAGYIDKPLYGVRGFKSPITGAYNVEPSIERGGAALAFDIGKTSWLLHAQAIPFITADKKAQTTVIDQEIAAAQKIIDDLRDPENPEGLPRLTEKRDAANWRKQEAEAELAAATTDEERAAAQEKIDAANADIVAAEEAIKKANDAIESANATIVAKSLEKQKIAADSGQPLLLEWTPAFSVTTEKMRKEAIDNAKKKIAEGEAEKVKAENERLKAEAKKAEAESRLAEGQRELDAAATEEAKAAAQAKIAAAQSELSAAKEELLKAEVAVGAANTKIAAGKAELDWAEKSKKINVYELAFPGKMLKIQETAVKEEVFIQDAVFTVRQFEGEKAWELTIGGGIGKLASDLITSEKEITTEKLIGQGGAFYKAQAPKSSWGIGAYLEAGPTNFEALAMLQESVETEYYLQSLWRIGTTLYGSKAVANNVLLGGLAHVLPQFTVAKEKPEWDHVFWRFIGFLKAMKSAAMIDVSRIPGFEEMAVDYDKMLANVNNDPKNAETYINKFKEQYETGAKQIFDNYYLGVQINKDLSIELSILAKEKEQEWTGQWPPETVQARALYTWDTGFWRIFASIPTWMTGGIAAVKTTERIGIVGTGVGFDAFSGFMLQRMAFDVGALLAIEDAERLEPGIKAKWGKPGWFMQGAVQLYSNVLEEAKRYRTLLENYAKYDDAIAKSAFKEIPSDILNIICANVPEDMFTPKLLKRIKDREMVILTDDQKDALSDALWEWFYDEKTKLEGKFNGKVNSYLAASGYFFDAGKKIYWDIGAFFEYVDNVKAYLIAAKREELGFYTGVDFYIKPKVVLGAVAGVTVTGKPQAGGGISFKLKVGPGWLGVYGYGKTAKPPVYSHPAYVPYEHTGKPEFGIVIYYLVGFGAGSRLQFVPPAPTYVPPGAPGPSRYP